MTDTPTIAFLKGALLASAGLVFFWPLATPLGLAALVVGTLSSTWLAHRLDGTPLRAAGWIGMVVLTLLGATLTSAALRANISFLDPSVTLWLSDALVLGLSAFALMLGLRLASARWRAASVVELALVVGAIGNFFAAHRHQRIHQPRFLSDWAWARGLEPELVLTVLGVVAAALSALLLLRVRRASRVLAMLALLLLGGLAVFLIGGRPSLVAAADDGGGAGEDGQSESDSKNDNQNNQSGGGGAPPRPIAVAVLHDDLPESDVLYFRQAVRSKVVGDRLVEDPAGEHDVDVPTKFPAGAPVTAELPQNPAIHRTLRTSMFLLADHAQLFGVGFPREFAPLQNPDPRRFVAAYDVESLFLVRPVERLLGRRAGNPSWSEAQLRHYLEVPADPRYRDLSDELVRDVDPRFVGDDVVKALTIKAWLEKRGFYSLKQKQLVGDDPVATFLFGDLKGYCVHFAHAAAYLFRSQGIPSRVAIGYAVETTQRGAGSSVLIFANEAHAWPEIFLEDVGWVTLDIYPEQSDQPPPQRVERDFESALGELARKPPPGLEADRRPWVIPWPVVGIVAALLLVALFFVALGVKAWRQLAVSDHRRRYRAVLDRLSDLGEPRRFGESRERHAQRLASVAPSFVTLTAAHLRLCLRGEDPGTAAQLEAAARATLEELRRNTPTLRRLAALFNPIGWWFTR